MVHPKQGTPNGLLRPQKSLKERWDQLLGQSGGVSCPNILTHQTMGLNRLLLNFNDTELETQFRQRYADQTVQHVRIVLFLGIIFYAAFGVLDAYLAPVVKYQLWAIRYFLICPVMIAAIVLFSYSFFKSLMQPILCGVMILSGVGIIAMVVIAPAPAANSYYAGVILVFMFGYTFSRMRFIWASVGGWVLVAMYEISAVIYQQIPAMILLNNNFFFIGANLIGMFASYFIEYYTRRDFYWALLLKEEERKVKQANRDLENQVKERTRQLLSANEGLKREIEAHRQLEEEKLRLQHQLQHAQKLEAIGTLAGGIAHDFNNILAAIVGYIELGLLRLPPDNACSTYLHQSLKACQRAKELIRQILTFSRRQQKKDRLPIHPKPIVLEIMGLLKASVPKNIELRQQIDPNIHTISVDTTHLHQVLMNLCMNAAQAMEKDGGELVVTVTNEAVTPDSNHSFSEIPAGEYVKFSIKDSGCGIDPSIRDRIFDPYFSTKERGKGSGMGLSVTHGIVKSYGGSIRFESRIGEGTTFDILFPKCKGMTISSKDIPESIPKGHESILYLDDEEYLTQMVSEMLSQLGYQITVSTDSMEALDLVRATPDKFDLVVTDMIMPKMSGIQFAGELEALGSKIPIILCSGLNDSVRPEVETSRNIVTQLIKPFSYDELARTVRRTIDGHMDAATLQTESQ
jgi:signal transduction histidine kinase/ActR/RegA family two-component response regulator